MTWGSSIYYVVWGGGLKENDDISFVGLVISWAMKAQRWKHLGWKRSVILNINKPLTLFHVISCWAFPATRSSCPILGILSWSPFFFFPGPSFSFLPCDNISSRDYKHVNYNFCTTSLRGGEGGGRNFWEILRRRVWMAPYDAKMKVRVIISS